MAVKEDLRIQKTKAALFDAFFSMLEEMPFEDLTVNDLCTRADIRRATFYKHYTDKFDFLNAATHRLRDIFDTQRWSDSGDFSPVDYYVAYAKRVVSFICEKERIVDNMLKSNLLSTMISIITEQNYLDTKKRLVKSVESGLVLKASIETVARMCSGGVAEVIYAWVKDGRKKNAEELAEEIGAIVSAIIS